MAANKGPLHQFEISSLYDIRLDNIDISFTNSALSMVLSILIATIIFYIGSAKNPNIPGRLQVLVEMSYDFVANMVRDNVGKSGKVFFLLYLLYFYLFYLEIFWGWYLITLPIPAI